MAIDAYQTRITFPADLGRFPAYSNATLVSIFNDDLVIDFGFIDPSSLMIAINNLQEQSEGEKPEEIRLPASPVSRLVINQKTAITLLKQLQEVLEQVEKIEEQ